ncbi:hypothetical protein HU200_041684 [Digitaria exilis]|uniref:Xyloglucan endotransglucosylase/hydrolase n=1 Tax=Digitaria exilis TaxID=1010633 RepID=A0A835B731_9POAL|nr:hypothetical protein HU200_041684 [Digitaria exilis]CAB3480442.1 unnamed protein product [Digitaria exilis]
MAAWLLSSSCSNPTAVLALLLTAMMAAPAVAMASLHDDIELMFGGDHFAFHTSGDGVETLALRLDKDHGAGFRSNEAYLFARYDIELMLVADDSAGTVTTVYLTPDLVPPEEHDEIDMEFLGNVTGEPYTLHTNIFVNGVGNREQQFRLWFDPSKEFHTYSVEWNPRHIIMFIDGTPIRVYKNEASHGVPFPTLRRLRLDGSLWNADDWATQGGRVKTNWTQAPFYAYYRNFRVTPCPGVASCGDKGVDEAALQRAREEHLLYDYCEDQNRFKDNGGLPKECTLD